MASDATAKRSVWNRRAEKEFLRQGTEGPYRKPTQVGELNMLRRTEEFALRNSAKCIRNFGRSMAAGGASSRRLQRNGPSDCLPKTQVHANQRWEVYGLTPARCWKVKRSRQRKRSGELKPQ